jgi:hypothetical protein
MRGRLGTGTEGVVGQEHGRRILPGGTTGTYSAVRVPGSDMVRTARVSGCGGGKGVLPLRSEGSSGGLGRACCEWCIPGQPVPRSPSAPRSPADGRTRSPRSRRAPRARAGRRPDRSKRSNSRSRQVRTPDGTGRARCKGTPRFEGCLMDSQRLHLATSFLPKLVEACLGEDDERLAVRTLHAPASCTRHTWRAQGTRRRRIVTVVPSTEHSTRTPSISFSMSTWPNPPSSLRGRSLSQVP